ncbi:P protein, partial [Pseudolycoriella hygida]
KINKNFYIFSEVTEGALKVWRSLPNTIRLDPSLAIIRHEHEKLHGQIVEEDEDPLPYENEDHHQDKNELKYVSVTSEKNAIKDDHHELHHTEEEDHTNRTQLQIWLHRIKIGVLVIVWIFFTYLLMTYGDTEMERRQIVVSPNSNRTFAVHEVPNGQRILIHLRGAFLPEGQTHNATNFLYLYLELLDRNDENGHAKNITSVRSIALVDGNKIDHVEEIDSEIEFRLGVEALSKVKNGEATLRVHMYTNIDVGLPLILGFDLSPLNESTGVICAAIVLLSLYVLIIWEIVHRTIAAIIASTLALAVLSVMHHKPPMEEIVGWIDIETLLLLFGMMLLVAILSETGVFDYLAVFSYKITSGRVWPLITCLAMFTAILSAFLDNVTTILLMAPVTIRLCEVMGLNPVPILMTMVIYSNVGGTLTPVGDPPNVIISSNEHVVASGVNFLNFTAHMFGGIALVLFQTYVQIRYKYRNMEDLRFSEPRGIQELRQELAVWQRAAASLSAYTRDEDLVRETLLKKASYLERLLKKRLATGKLPKDTYKTTLVELQQKYPIRNMKLLIKSGFALAFTITFFFLHAAPDIQKLSIGWVALLGAMLLLILADREDIESVIAHVEWATLLFFAALFVLMEALAELGLIEWIGRQTENLILGVSEDARLAVAILIILWVSALASAFVDNIPLTTMMIKIVISLSENDELGLPMHPLVWALAFGACLGGNGTLIGASANVVCAGVAQQHGYKFTFMDFFKVGFPIMIGHIIVTTAYLMVVHVLFAWH